MKCLLCKSVAVADCLCVECGAKLWAAQFVQLIHQPYKEAHESDERAKALREFCDPNDACAFLRHYDTARATHEAKNRGCPECGRLVPRDEHKPNCPRSK